MELVITIGSAAVAAFLAALVWLALTTWTRLPPWVILFFTFWALLAFYAAGLSIRVGG